jgi:hypothetical protein
MAGVVLIGSGPSLNLIDLEDLTPFPSITFNRAYLAWPTWPFEPSLHACTDPVLARQIAGEIDGVVGRTRARFFVHQIATEHGLRSSDRVSFLRMCPGEAFTDRLDLLTDFGNVGATSMQILQGLGYDRVLLVGVDARYTQPADHDPAAIAAGHVDPDHFLPGYRAGIAFDTTTERSVYTRGWPLVARESTRRGIEIRNASHGSSLDCFPRCSIESGLRWLRGAVA